MIGAFFAMIPRRYDVPWQRSNVNPTALASDSMAQCRISSPSPVLAKTPAALRYSRNPLIFQGRFPGAEK
jgi:hypothetical protein